MKRKRKYVRVSHEIAVSIVRAYHLENQTQVDLARLHGMSAAYAGRIAHGEAHPLAFDEVFHGVRLSGAGDP